MKCETRADAETVLKKHGRDKVGQRNTAGLFHGTDARREVKAALNFLGTLPPKTSKTSKKKE